MILYSLASDIICELFETVMKGLAEVNHSVFLPLLCSSELFHVSQPAVLNPTLESQAVGRRLPPTLVCMYNNEQQAVLQCSGSYNYIKFAGSVKESLGFSCL